MSEALPQVFKRHVFMCLTQRPPGHPHGSCGAAGNAKLFELMKARLEVLGLGGDIGLTSTGCLGFCAAQPLMVVYPEGVWYRPRTPEDVEEIVTTHLREGQIVERLAMVLTR
ncbi:ferredoxin [Acidocella sp.]|uniref:(2Fe-2S) ferredoxin domain-containing protein n=1 Tax=Acidocella sp. TaxID=50710 RepID=UPI0026308A31|nr:(2Fe-2S) ferredoxin domain-containing protein [Acidocella sp.]